MESKLTNQNNKLSDGAQLSDDGKHLIVNINFYRSTGKWDYDEEYTIPYPKNSYDNEVAINEAINMDHPDHDYVIPWVFEDEGGLLVGRIVKAEYR